MAATNGLVFRRRLRQRAKASEPVEEGKAATATSMRRSRDRAAAPTTAKSVARMAQTRRVHARQRFRRRRGCESSSVASPVPTPPSLADDLASLSATYPQLAFPLELAAPHPYRSRACCGAAAATITGGAAAAPTARRCASPTSAVRMAEGGVASARQRDLRGRPQRRRGARIGNCGSKVFAFMVDEWVVARSPHLLFVELAINDGDTLLESGGDDHSLGCALEGLLRRVREALPACEVVVLLMFVRDDLPLHARTGSKAWSDNSDAAAAAAYHEAVPALHAAVAAHYGLPCIDLVPLFSTRCRPPRAHRLSRRLPPHRGRRRPRRRRRLPLPQRSLRRRRRRRPLAPLPAPLRRRVAAGRARRVSDRSSRASTCNRRQPTPRRRGGGCSRARPARRRPAQPTSRARGSSRTPATSPRSTSRARASTLTMVGPDSGTVVCDVDGGRWSARRCLLDRWAYF